MLEEILVLGLPTESPHDPVIPGGSGLLDPSPQSTSLSISILFQSVQLPCFWPFFLICSKSGGTKSPGFCSLPALLGSSTSPGWLAQGERDGLIQPITTSEQESLGDLPDGTWGAVSARRRHKARDPGVTKEAGSQGQETTSGEMLGTGSGGAQGLLDC